MEQMLKKRVLSNNYVTVLKACGKPALADVNCYCKMTLDRVTLFLRLKDVTNTCINICETVQLSVGFLQFNGEKLEEDEDFKCIFVVYCVLESK